MNHSFCLKAFADCGKTAERQRGTSAGEKKWARLWGVLPSAGNAERQVAISG